MIVIFCSSFSGKHPALQKVERWLKVSGVEYVVVNPQSLSSSNILLTEGMSGLYLHIDDRGIKPSGFIFLNNWRADCAIDIPNGVKYPGIHRNRVRQFLQDIRFAFEDCVWMPGRIEDIERADSKPRLMLEAREVGLSVPQYTCNTGGIGTRSNTVKESFRKSLGPPFAITLNRDSGSEVGVTVTNTIISEHTHDGQLWQWQEPIPNIAQVRCFTCGDRTWSVIWNKADKDKFTDYRQFGEVQGNRVEWSTYELPKTVALNLQKLLQRMGLLYASPEFLINEQEEYVFIDLNPCGDWSGFFGEKIEQEILAKIFAM